MKWWETIVVSGFLLTASLWAQTGGSLSGRIADDRGGGVPNAIILLTNTDTGQTQRVVATADGSFTVAMLPPGSYRVEVEVDGKRQAGSETVVIQPDAAADIQVAFRAPERPGEPAGAVEIRATAPTLQTESAEVSRGYNTRTVRSLPVLDRQHQELIGLMPGVTPPQTNGDHIMDPQQRRIYHVNGQADWANVHQQDGALNQEYFGGNIARIAPNEAIQSLNVRTSNYNAEYGFAGGGWVNTVTRPGTNEVHGSLFFFNTNNFFAARNPLNTGNNPAPRFTQNQFGGTVGMPIMKDRLFGFLSYDGRLRRGNQLRFATVPTALMRTGNLSEFDAPILNPVSGNPLTGAGRTPFRNNTIPQSQINPFARGIVNSLPLPNQSGLTNNFVGNALLEDDTHRLDGKVDYRPSDKTTGFLRYGFTHGKIDRGSLLGPLGDAANAGLRNHNAVASVSSSLTETLLGELRFGYTRFRNAISPLGTPDINPASFGFSEGLPQINVWGFSDIGLAGNIPGKMINNSWDGATNWLWHTGMHRLKFGVDVRRIDASGFDAGFFSPRGSFIFGPGSTTSPAAVGLNQFDVAGNSLAAFLTGAPMQAGVSSFLETPTYRQWQYAGYLTDTIKLWQRLHLELGVRYDVYSPLQTRRDLASTIFNPFTNDVRFGQLHDEYDMNNIAPRVGFAYRATDRMAIRGGYGIHYFPIPFSRSAINQRAAALQSGVSGDFRSTSFRVPNITDPGQGIATNQPFFIGREKPETPYIQTFSFMVQGDMGHGFLGDVGYVGTLGRQLPFSSVLAGTPGSGRSGLPFPGRTAQTVLRDQGLNSNYNSFQANLTKRFAGGFAMTGAYTFSKALDYGEFELLNPFNRRANYGPADWDRSHILSVSHVWQLPFGRGTSYANSGWMARLLGDWELNGILRWATGTPFTVTANPLGCACPGVNAISADIRGDFIRSDSGAFNANAFSLPANGFGNLGRNALRGPDLFNYNLALFRNFTIMENTKLEFRAEAYNLTNSANYANPVSVLGAPGFGQPLNTFNGMGGRQFQVAGRLLF